MLKWLSISVLGLLSPLELEEQQLLGLSGLTSMSFSRREGRIGPSSLFSASQAVMFLVGPLQALEVQKIHGCKQTFFKHGCVHLVKIEVWADSASGTQRSLVYPIQLSSHKQLNPCIPQHQGKSFQGPEDSPGPGREIWECVPIPSV